MAKKTRVYGLTGGIACGKSVVAGYFKALGCGVVDADRIAHELTEKRQEGWQKIREAFPPVIFDPNGELNREKLSSFVFSDEKKRQQLEAILHPLILKRMRQEIQDLFRRYPLVIVEAALIYEGSYEKEFDGVIVVSCAEKQQVERLCQKRGMSSEKAISMIRAQMPLEDKVKRANYVIDNSGHLNETYRIVKEVYQKLK